MEKTKEKRSFQAPHTFVILVVLILIAVAATYVVPAGEYTGMQMRQQEEPLLKQAVSTM